MKYVLDPSVALKWVLPEIHAAKAKQLRDDYENQIHQLVAPDVFPVEVSYALVRAERKKIISIGQAAALLVDVMNSAPFISSYLSLLSRATDIHRHRLENALWCLRLPLFCAGREGGLRTGYRR